MSYRNGTYTARILGAGSAEKKTKGGEMYLRLYLKVQPLIWRGQSGEELDYSHDEPQYVNLNLIRSNEDSIRYAMQDLEGIGFVGTASQFVSHDWQGQEIEVYCKHSEYDGKVYANWNISRPRPDVDEKVLSSFDKLMSKFASKKQPPKATAKPPVEQKGIVTQVGTEDASEDIPF